MPTEVTTPVANTPMANPDVPEHATSAEPAVASEVDAPPSAAGDENAQEPDGDDDAADFLAEAFGTPALPMRDKETLHLMVLETLKNMVENPNEDTYVLQSVIQASASIYPLAIRWMYVAKN